MNKHAYLIIAHNEFYILERLLKLIDDKRNDIYLHIDKKVKNFDFEYYKRLVKHSKIYFTDRINVSWGKDTQIKCELLLLKEATKQKYDYYHLLSGVDLPLKNQDEIHNFFNKCGHKDFVHFCYHHEVNNHIIERVKYHHLFLKNIRSNNKTNRFISQKLHSILLRIQKIINYSRIKNEQDKYYYGANWFSITDELANYIVSKGKQILKKYKNTLCADEIFLQTLVFNSKFYKNLYLYEDDNYKQIMRYIDWKRGEPYTFTIDDYNLLTESNMLFARKTSTKTQKEKQLVDKIYKNIKTNERKSNKNK